GGVVGRGGGVGGRRGERSRLDAIEAAGLEPAGADPDRPGTILELCGDVAAVIWLLGSASGSPAALAAIHGSRLERLLEKLVDSPGRGVVYGGAGGVPGQGLSGGRKIVERAGGSLRSPGAGRTDRTGEGSV